MPTNTDTHGQRRVIGALDAFSIVAGSMLGIGIFLSPPIVAQYTTGPWAFIAMWLLGGLVALAGAVACAELGTMMPRAGGDYIFQYEAYGPSVAFASGCVLFGAIFCGSIATLSVGLATYQLPALFGLDLAGTSITLPWGFQITGVQIAALLIVAAVTLLNVFGASVSARTQTIVTIVPMICFAALAMVALIFAQPVASFEAQVARPLKATSRDLAVAYSAVYFAYSGWLNIVYVAGEVIDPSRNIPRALLGGTLLITALYALLCGGFLAALGIDGVAAAGEAGTKMATVLMGSTGGTAMAFLVACALAGCINGTALGGARVAYAMAHHGVFWANLGKVTTPRNVPANALWLQGVLSALLILSGRFEQLYTMVSLAMVVTGTLTVGSVFVLRRTKPHAERPYMAAGYPWLPGFYVIASLAVIVVMVTAAISGQPQAWQPLLGVGILIAAYVGHRLCIGNER
ncbi:MAG: APA family basic amino acid/polyamine antiporter [Hyphomicrobiaceae bacterium]|jgi:APA family basic amino acid/polyamine antiporter